MKYQNEFSQSNLKLQNQSIISYHTDYKMIKWVSLLLASYLLFIFLSDTFAITSYLIRD